MCSITYVLPADSINDSMMMSPCHKGEIDGDAGAGKDNSDSRLKKIEDGMTMLMGTLKKCASLPRA